jgi:hypothetical protein
LGRLRWVLLSRILLPEALASGKHAEYQ